MANIMTPEMIADFLTDCARAAVDREYRSQLYDGKCPYTNDPCDNWDCENCEIEREEVEWLEELDQEEQAEIEVTE